MEEEWKDIYYYNKSTKEWIDYRGLYQVSNLGRVRSLDRYVRGYNHGVEHIRLAKGGIIKTRPNKNGYYLAHLAKEGKHRDYSLHRLVYFSFNPDADTLLTVNHKDEDKTNNALNNLELMSQLDNNRYGTRGTRIKEKLAGVKKGPMAEYHKQLISNGLKNSVKAQTSRIKAVEHIKIPIVQCDNCGNIIAEYKSAADAERQLNIFSQSINACCRGKRKTAGGYIWKYKT